MRTAGERTVLCLTAVLAAGLAYAGSTCAAQKAGKAPVDKHAAPATPSFQVKPESLRPLNPAAGFIAYDSDAIELALEGGFALPPAAAGGDVRLLDTDRYYEGVGPVSWRSNAFSHQAQPGGPIDSVRVSMAGAAPTAAYAPLTLSRPDAYELREVDVTVTRGWPSAVMLAGRKYALDVIGAIENL